MFPSSKTIKRLSSSWIINSSENFVQLPQSNDTFLIHSHNKDDDNRWPLRSIQTQPALSQENRLPLLKFLTQRQSGRDTNNAVPQFIMWKPGYALELWHSDLKQFDAVISQTVASFRFTIWQLCCGHEGTLQISYLVIGSDTQVWQFTPALLFSLCFECENDVY